MVGARRFVGSFIAHRLRLSAVLLGLFAVIAPAYAQGWPSWPWSQPEQRPQQRPQIQPLPPQSVPPPGAPALGQRPPADGMNPKERFCYQLEQKLVQSSTQGSQAQQQLPKIEQEMRQLEGTFQRSRAQLEQSDCFEYFLFSKTLRRTRQCYDLNRQVEEGRQRLADLQAQRQSITGSRSSRDTQDEIIQALARNGCGANYQQEAARRARQSGPLGFPWGGGDDDEGGPGGGMRQQGSLPFSTYRTVCVRLCDGYYFPVSFSTMQSQFPKDAQACATRCAAPAELYYYQNPGGEMEQAMSVAGLPYSKLPNAFRHRKEVVQGCSCKQADYQPDMLSAPGKVGQKRADQGGPVIAGQPQPGQPVPKRVPQQAGAPGAKTAGAPAAQEQDLIAQTIERDRDDTRPR